MSEIYLDIDDVQMDEVDIDNITSTLEFAGNCIKMLRDEVKRLREENKKLKAELEEMVLLAGIDRGEES